MGHSNFRDLAAPIYDNPKRLVNAYRIQAENEAMDTLADTADDYQVLSWLLNANLPRDEAIQLAVIRLEWLRHQADGTLDEWAPWGPK